MFWYPVPRHMFPSSSCRISSSVGFGLRSSNALVDMIMPGVQYPHCKPCFSQNASWIGWYASPSASPSIVSIELPSTCTASLVHDLVVKPSTVTTHAPHWLVSHPTWVPCLLYTSDAADDLLCVDLGG